MAKTKFICGPLYADRLLGARSGLEGKVKEFQKDLLSWFEQEKRSLPWRENGDPYRIWVSEIMLQQTRVDTVIPYYYRFMERFPSIKELAEADLEDVYRVWEGLGYYSRAKNLHTAVREVKEQYGGVVPDTPEEIHKLKGIGPYTAGAILSIAYGQPEPAVDGNVMRVLSRIFLIQEDISKTKTRKLFEDLVRKIIFKGNPSYFNQSLMELGALVCTPKSPKCLTCPVHLHCQAVKEGMQEELPVKKESKKGKSVEMAVGLVCNQENQWLICKRPAKGLLANLWEFPGVEGSLDNEKMQEELSKFLFKNFGVRTIPEKEVLHYSHVFSHLQWNIHLFLCSFLGLEKDIGLPREYKWVTIGEMKEFPFSVSHRKIVEYIKSS